MAIEFFHLHTHMSHSVLDGLGSPERWVDEAVKKGMSALAMTDHASVSGYVEFMKAAKGRGVKPIVGCEFYFCDNAAEKTKGETRNHITVLAKNWDGFCSIMGQLTRAHEQFYYKPRLGLSDLFGFGNCVVMTGCTVGVLSRADWLKLTQDLFETYGEDFYLEIMPHAFSDQYEVNRRAASAAALMGTKLVATNDCHYPLKEDALTHEILLAVQTGGKWDDPKRFKFGFDGLYLRDLGEMAEAFRKQEERFPIADQLLQALKATAEIVEKCNVEPPRIEMALPQIFDDEEGELRKICAQGWKEKIVPFVPAASQKVYRDRLIHEMQLIRRMGFVRYFLMVWDIVSYSRSRGIFVGPGRGSVGGSLVAYLMDLHHVDPIWMKLYFERFINPGRVDWPDIDLDFQADRREEVFAYIERKYGKGKVAHISTNSILQRKSAFRDVSRVFGVPAGEIDSLSKTVENDIPLEEQLVSNSDLRSFAEKHPVVLPNAEALTGQIRTKGLHAAGVIVSASGFSGRAVLERRESARAVNWDMKECDQFGLIKIDILGLRNLTILQDAANMVNERKGIEIDYKAVRLDDPKVLDLFSQAHTVGVFQFEGSGISNVLKQIAPIEDFETLVHVNALYRPGPKGSGILDKYIESRHGAIPSYLHKIQKEITKDTYGALLFQEQVMEIFHRMAGFTWAEADTVRKIISKSMGEEEFAKHRTHFIEGCAKNGVEKNLAEELFSELANFSQYAFNKAHSAEYSLIAYWTAYMKVYHPHEFMTALLSTMLGSEEDQMKRCISECRRLGIQVMTPDLNKSKAGYVLDGDVIYTGFARIKNVGTKAADSIVKAREAGPFADIWDFLARVERRSVNSLVVRHLIYAGAFDGIHPGENRTLLENLETIQNGKKELKRYPEWPKDVLLKNKAGVLKGVYTTAFDDVKMKMKPPGPEIKSLKDALALCRKCKLAETATQPVPPEYTRNSKLFCLAEAPGEEENKAIRPLCGPGGKKFMAILQEETSLTRSRLFLMNTYNCWPGKENVLPCGLEDTCYEYVERAIRVMRPTVILCMGNTPLKFLTGKAGGIQSLSGQYDYIPRWGALVVYCVHPSSIFRDPENEPRFRKAMRCLKKFI